MENGDCERLNGFSPCQPALGVKNAAPSSNVRPVMSQPSSLSEIADLLRANDSFLILSHVRPDGDAIGSQIALGAALMEIGKKVYLVNQDGLPENMAFLKMSDAIMTPPSAPLDVDVVVALDTANKPRLGEDAIAAGAKAKFWINIDHHISNPGYGDYNFVNADFPATGEIIYTLLLENDFPIPPASRDAIYVAVSTDTGSFQYRGTTPRTYRMAADLLERGLDVAAINTATYDNHPYRRVELMRELLNTLEISEDGRIANWSLTYSTKQRLQLQPDDSEGLIDIIRAIRGVQVAIFFEEISDKTIRVSMRSKDERVNVCEICQKFGGGGHKLAAGIRMDGPMELAKQQVLAEVAQTI